MMNKKNIELVTSKEVGYEFIIGERMKNLPNLIKDIILDRSKYKELIIKDDNAEEDLKIEYYMIEYEGRRIINTYIEKRAAKGRHEREEKIAMAKEFISTPAKVEKKAANHFL